MRFTASIPLLLVKCLIVLIILSECGREVPSPLTTAPAQVPVPRLPTYWGCAALPVPLSRVDKKALLVKGGVDATWCCIKGQKVSALVV